MAEPGIQFVDDFKQTAPGRPPCPWEAEAGSAWWIDELSRPRLNRECWPAVISPHMHVAFPGIARDAKRNRLYVVYRQGYTHATRLAGRDGAIMMVVSNDNGETWSRPQCIFDDPDIDDRNAAVQVMSNGAVVVCFDQYLNGWHYRAQYIVSRDGGKTWSEPVPLGTTKNLTCRCSPIELSNGEWLFPVYCHFGTDTIGGYAVIVDPKTGKQEQYTVARDPKEPAGDEWAVVETEPGKLLAMMRDNNRPFLWQAFSEDYGRTWTPRQPSEIPSQFAPCHLFMLPDGRVACSFSFRERRNERLVLSSDKGKTWDIENSLDIYDATVGYVDRSYVVSVPLDDHTVGSVIYETRTYPHGGQIVFCRTDLRQIERTRTFCLHHRAPNRVSSISLPLNGTRCTVSIRYRFTGRFGERPNGLEIHLSDTRGEASFRYWMGIDPKCDFKTTNRWEAAVKTEDKVEERCGECQGDSFNDGNEHTLTLAVGEDRIVGLIDDYQQVELPCVSLAPTKLRLIAHRASIAVYRVEIWS